MKIAFIVGQFPRLSEAFIVNQASSILERGHELSIYAIQGLPEDCSNVHPIVNQYDLLSKTKVAKPVPNFFFGRLLTAILLLIRSGKLFSLSWLPLINGFKYGREAWSLRLLYYGIPFLDQESYDVIHAQFGGLGKLALTLKDMNLIQGKLITHFRGHDISIGLAQKDENPYQYLFKKGEFFLTNCKFFQQRLLSIGCPPDRTRIHGSSIDCSKFIFKERQLPIDGILKIATVGRLVEKKGIEFCIRAIAQLIQEGMQIEYTVIGDGPLEDKFINLIQTLKLNTVVRLVGSKNQQEIIEILNQSHLFLAPSVTAENGDQDAPVNTLKEAMSMGLPVVSTWHGGIPELVEDGVSGYLVPERDSDAIAEKIKTLAQQADRWSEMGRAGRHKVIELYDINTLGDELISTYQDILHLNINV
jgi:colanic acid/amylovoran biosynthesis glycosyltransferase